MKDRDNGTEYSDVTHTRASARTHTHTMYVHTSSVSTVDWVLRHGYDADIGQTIMKATMLSVSLCGFGPQIVVRPGH